MQMIFKKLYFDNSTEVFFVEGDKNIVAYHQLIDLFGEPDILLVGVEKGIDETDIFNSETLSAVHEITDFFDQHELVVKTRSITKYQYTHTRKSLLKTSDLFEDSSEFYQKAALEKARALIPTEPLALERIVTPDLSRTQVIAKTDYRPGENAHNVQLVTDLKEFLIEKKYKDRGIKIYLSGSPLISSHFETVSKRDMAMINPSMAVLIALFLLMSFRSIPAALVALTAVGFTFISVTAVQASLGWPFTVVNTALIPISIIVGMSGSIHLLVTFFQLRSNSISPTDASKASINRLFKPMFFASLTTSIGFSMLAVTDLMPVRQFAILAALVPFLLFLVMMTTLPALLSFCKKNHSDKSFTIESFARKVTQWLPQKLYEKRIILVFIAVFLTFTSVYFSSKVEVDTNYTNYFRSADLVKRDLTFFDKYFKGTMNFEFILDSGEVDGIYDPVFLSRAENFQSYVEGLPETGKALSVMDFLKQINKALNSNSQSFYQLPTSHDMSAQLLLLYENSGPNENLADMKSYDNRYLRVSVPAVNLDSAPTAQLLAKIEQAIDTEFADLEIATTGRNVLYNLQNRYISEGMLYSFLLAFISISISFLFVFRSFKYGMCAMIPSVVPTLIGASIAYILGISLDIGTMIIGAMTLGIAVDDSIHVMSRYRAAKSEGECTDSAIKIALNESGKAIILSSIILVIGFGSMIFASFIPYIYTGLFSALIMFMALVGDLVFLPAILYVLDRETIVEESSASAEIL